MAHSMSTVATKAETKAFERHSDLKMADSTVATKAETTELETGWHSDPKMAASTSTVATKAETTEFETGRMMVLSDLELAASTSARMLVL